MSTRKKKAKRIRHPNQLFDSAALPEYKDQSIDSDDGSSLCKDEKEVTDEPLGGPGWVSDAKRKTPPRSRGR